MEIVVTLPEKTAPKPEREGTGEPVSDSSLPTPEKNKEEGKGAVVVRVTGEVDLHTGPDLRTTLQRIADDGHHHIVVDMTRVPYVDSFALGVMVDTQRRLKERGGDLYLAHITPFVMRAFEITRLIRIFNVVHSVEEAVQIAGQAGRSE